MITSAQLDKLHHMLGVTPTKRVPFRNHYVSGQGDLADMEALDAAGLVKRRAMDSRLTDGCPCFNATEEGKAYAIDNLPPAPVLSRYGEYLEEDGFRTFAQFLGIEKPEYETQRYCAYGVTPLIRMKSSKAVGEFCKTKVAAKASYKAALKVAKGK
jgi:hypothetical protein